MRSVAVAIALTLAAVVSCKTVAGWWSEPLEPLEAPVQQVELRLLTGSQLQL
jgi:hypothetical protein